MVHRLASGDGPAVEVSLRQTVELARRADRAPERTVGRYVARAFDRLDVPYRIVYDLPVADDAPPSAAGKHAALRWWRSALNEVGVPDTGRDANVLLTAAKGGGLAAVGGWAAVAPGGSLIEEFDLVDTCSPDDPRHVIYGVLHELAHCLGSSHDRPWGKAWADHDRQEFHRTPETFPDRTNACGEHVPARPEGYARVDHLYFSECTGQQLRQRLAEEGPIREGDGRKPSPRQGAGKRSGGKQGGRKQPGRKRTGPGKGRGRPRREPWSPIGTPWVIRNFRE